MLWVFIQSAVQASLVVFKLSECPAEIHSSSFLSFTAVDKHTTRENENVSTGLREKCRAAVG